MIFLVLTSQFFVFATFAEVSESEASLALANAEVTVVSAYQAVLKAEEAGANVSGLLDRLNEAGENLAYARMAYNHNPRDLDKTISFANSGKDIAEEVQNAAVKLRDSALSGSMRRMLYTMIASVVSVAFIALGSLWFWHLLKKRYGSGDSPKRISGCGFR